MGLNAHSYSVFADMLDGLASKSLVNYVVDGRAKKSSRSTKVTLAGDPVLIEKTLLEGDTVGKLEAAMNGLVRGKKSLFD